MSLGGPYTIASTSGYEDQVLNASEKIKQIAIQVTLQKAVDNGQLESLRGWIDFKEKKLANGVRPEDFCKEFEKYTPSISFLKTHTNIFLNSSYKPYAPVGQQYFKKSYSNPKWGSTVRIALDKIGQFICDPVVHIRLEGLAALSPVDRVKYFDMPGMRIFKQVKFDSKRTTIDSYYGDYYNIYYKQHVPADKREIFERMMGQQKTYTTWLTQDPRFDLQQQKVTVADGAQTFKQTQDTLDLWIPLLLFFRDYKNAMPQMVTSWGQVEIEFQLNRAEDIIAYADYGGGGAYTPPKITVFNLYMNNIFTDPFLYSMIASKLEFFLFRPHKQVIKRLTSPKDSIRLFDEIKWPSQLLEFGFKPVANAGISTHWHSYNVLNSSYMRVPVLARNDATVITGTVTAATAAGTTAIGITAAGLSATPGFYTGYYFIVTAGRGFQVDVSANRYTVTTSAAGSVTVSPGAQFAFDATTTFDLYIPQLQLGPLQFYSESGSPIDRVRLRSDNVDLIEDNPSGLLSLVAPWKANGIVGSTDDGLQTIAFGLEQQEHSPSGHFSFSATAETYLNYESSYISEDSPVDVLISSRALNFLYISHGADGSNINIYFP